MMRPLVSLVILVLLAACGADGPPVPPKPKAAPAPQGLSVGGQVEIGVSGSL